MCVWVEDADKLEIASNELEIVYNNRRVDSFLKSRECLGIAGTKGQGKTFLIKVKRKKVETDFSVCLPTNITVDTLDSSLQIDNSLFKLLADYHHWVLFWKVAICVVIINYIRENYADEEVDVCNLTVDTKKLFSLKNRNYRPSVVINAMLQTSIQDVLRIISDVANLMTMVSNLNKSVAVFIDKIDQGFSNYAKNFNVDSVMSKRSRNASFWQYAQFGLAEAAYDIFAIGTHHIKVYFTIRQEALIDSERINKDKARNILSYLSTLEYSKNDLEMMYKLYIQNEDDSNLINKDYKDDEPSIAFLGISDLEHGYINGASEKVFDYIYRHTLQRPYDIMKICRALYMAGKDIDIQNIRHIINNEGNIILQLYLQELSNFIPIDIEHVIKIGELLNSNILCIDYMKEACDVLNKELAREWKCNSFCQQCSNVQPFSILYNLGLIGVIQKHQADVTSKQKFLNIGSSILGLNEHRLPMSPYYFVHPLLANYSRDVRCDKGLQYWNDNQIVIGDGCNFEPINIAELMRDMRRNMSQLKNEKVFISSTINDLRDKRDAIQGVLLNRGLHPIMSEKPEFDISEAQNSHSHDHCIDELLKCKSVIFLIGESYGGIYNGNKYKAEFNEIKMLAAEANKTITPSISLMEYYVARKHNLICYAFIDQGLEKRIYQDNDISVNADICNEVKFINHIKLDDMIKGNWISPYESIEDLKIRINSLRFSTM